MFSIPRYNFANNTNTANIKYYRYLNMREGVNLKGKITIQNSKLDYF